MSSDPREFARVRPGMSSHLPSRLSGPLIGLLVEEGVDFANTTLEWASAPPPERYREAAASPPHRRRRRIPDGGVCEQRERRRRRPLQQEDQLRVCLPPHHPSLSLSWIGWDGM